MDHLGLSKLKKGKKIYIYIKRRSYVAVNKILIQKFLKSPGAKLKLLPGIPLNFPNLEIIANFCVSGVKGTV